MKAKLPDKSRRILLVEDDKTIRRHISKILQSMGYKISLAINSIDALAIFTRTSFDLVITDFEMPGVNGLSLAKNIKKRSPDVPVILMTGYDEETVFEMDRGSVDSILFKPFSLKEIQTTVQRVLNI